MNRTLAVITRMFASAALVGPGALAAGAAFAATAAPQPTPAPETVPAPRRPVSAPARPRLAAAA